MCDTELNNTNKYDVLCCSACLSSNRKLSELNEYLGLFRKICDYPLTTNINLCWECMGMLKKMEMFQARVFEAQRIMQLHYVENQYTQKQTLSNIKICSTNQIIEIMYNDKLDMVEKTEPNEEIIELQGIDKVNADGEDKNHIKQTEIKEEVEDCGNSNDYYDDIKEEFLQLIKQEHDLRNVKKTHPKKYKYVFDIKDEQYIKKFTTDYENIKRWLERDRDSDVLNNIKFKCMTCLYFWKSKRPSVQHRSKFHCLSAGQYICDICSSHFKTKQSMIQHIKKHEIAFECVACAFKCSSPDVMKVHLRSHKSVVQCLTCDMMLENVALFRVHYKAMHTCFICDHCGKRCYSKRMLEKHMRNVHNFDKFECKHCKKIFKNSRNLGKHMWMQHLAPTSTELAYCAPCDKQFETQGLYYQHVRSSSKHAAERTDNNAKVPCPECTNVYSRKTYMMNHYRHVHMKQTKYYCSMCDKYFLNSTRYVAHMRYNHEGRPRVKNKICTVCGKGFSENRILVNHMRTHSGERPFECPHCGSRFAQKYAMQTHVKNIHGMRKKS